MLVLCALCIVGSFLLVVGRVGVGWWESVGWVYLAVVYCVYSRDICPGVWIGVGGLVGG